MIKMCTGHEEVMNDQCLMAKVDPEKVFDDITKNLVLVCGPEILMFDHPKEVCPICFLNETCRCPVENCADACISLAVEGVMNGE